MRNTALAHAISPGPAAEAAHYAAIDRAERADQLQERLTQRTEEIIDSFDATDAGEALAIAADHGRDAALNEALAAITQINPSDERPAVRALLLAWRNVADYYAGHQAAQELRI